MIMMVAFKIAISLAVLGALLLGGFAAAAMNQGAGYYHPARTADMPAQGSAVALTVAGAAVAAGLGALLFWMWS